MVQGDVVRGGLPARLCMCYREHSITHNFVVKRVTEGVALARRAILEVLKVSENLGLA